MIFIRIQGIMSFEMDGNFEITVKLKSTGESATWTRCLMNCAYANYTAPKSEGIKNLMMALYQYYLAAKAQFNP